MGGGFGWGGIAHRSQIGTYARASLLATLLLSVPAFAAIAGRVVPAGAAIDDTAFELPPFPSAPRFVPMGTGKVFTSARAELTFRKKDGREIAGWYVHLHLPRERRPASRSWPEAPGPRRHPLIVVLPAGGMRKDLGSFFARGFAEHGFAVLELKRPPPEAEAPILRSLRRTAEALTEDAANLSRVIEWASTLPQVDPGRIGVIGVSRAANAAALVAQLRPRTSTVLVLGGAGLGRLLMESRIKTIKTMLEREVARADGGTETVTARASLLLANVDPATRAGRLEPSRTLLVNARWDRVIPRSHALDLRRAAGGATQAWLPSGHYGALVFAGRVRGLAIEHFGRSLAAPDPSPRGLTK